MAGSRRRVVCRLREDESPGSGDFRAVFRFLDRCESHSRVSEHHQAERKEIAGRVVDGVASRCVAVMNPQVSEDGLAQSFALLTGLIRLIPESPN
jgi:hypothetical protein